MFKEGSLYKLKTAIDSDWWAFFVYPFNGHTIRVSTKSIFLLVDKKIDGTTTLLVFLVDTRLIQVVDDWAKDFLREIMPE